MASTGFLLRKDDYPNGIATSADVEKLAALLNPYLTNVNTLISQGGNSFSDNFACEVQTGTFSHNVASGFSLKKLTAAKGCVVLGCDKGFPVGVTMKAVQVNVAGSLPQVSVTVLFSDPTITGAKVALLLLPEGQLFTAS
jgi:hypothetical protein